MRIKLKLITKYNAIYIKKKAKEKQENGKFVAAKTLL